MVDTPTPPTESMLMKISTSEIWSIILSSTMLGVLGFVGHTISTVTEVDYRRLVGGILFSGFVSSVTCMLLMATGMDPWVCAPLSGMLGASGEVGFDILMKRYWQDRNDR